MFLLQRRMKLFFLTKIAQKYKKKTFRKYSETYSEREYFVGRGQANANGGFLLIIPRKAAV